MSARLTALVALLTIAAGGCATASPAAAPSACARSGPANSADEVCPLLPGMDVPDVNVAAIDGTVVNVKALSQAPTVFIFYRGGWCPFCNVQMGQLQAIEGELKALGYQVVAMSPDDAAGLRASVAKHTLSYTLLSDTGLSAASRFGVAFAVDAPMSLALRAMAPQHDALPVPAVFVVRDGVVQFSYVNPNFKVRLSPELLLAAAKAAVPAPAP